MLALPRQQRGGDGQVALHKAACPEAVNDCSCLSAPWKTPNLQCLSLFYPTQSLINGKAQFPKVFVDSKQEDD